MKYLQYYDQISNVMARSGDLVMQWFRGDYTVFEKQGSFVTTVDFENELFLKSDFMWVIDPLDGTRNFIKGIPHFCIMIALTYKDEPIVAAIYNPITKELYYAEKGKGLWLDGKQIQFINRLIETKSAIVVCSDIDVKFVRLKIKENKIQISRRYFGSAGIDAIYLATGSIDFVIFRDIAWWDVVAGMLLMQEAGKLVCNYEKTAQKNNYGTL